MQEPTGERAPMMGVQVHKRGGEGYMSTIPSNQNQRGKEKGDTNRREGVQPWKDDPLWQVSANKQWQQTTKSARIKLSKPKDSNQLKLGWRKVITNSIKASCVIILLMKSGANGDYYNCRSPIRMEQFAQPTACDVVPAGEEQPLGKTFEVLIDATTR